MQQQQATSIAMSSKLPLRPTRLPADVVSECAWILAEDSEAWVVPSPARLNSVRDLGSCSLVCKLWRDACRPILWHNLALVLEHSWTPPWPENNLKYDELATMLYVHGRPPAQVKRQTKSVESLIDFLKDHPHLSRYVRALALTADLQSGTVLPGFIFLQPDVLSELLRCLPFIRDLHLKNIEIKLGIDANLTEVALPHLRQLSYTFTETIAGGPLRGTEDLLAPLRVFTDIDQFLIIRHLSFGLESELGEDFPVRLDPVVCRVRSVSVNVDTPWLPNLLKGLQRDLDPTHLHSLELSILCTDTFIWDVAPLLHKFVHSLKRLSMRFSVPPVTELGQYSALVALMENTDESSADGDDVGYEGGGGSDTPHGAYTDTEYEGENEDEDRGRNPDGDEPEVEYATSEGEILDDSEDSGGEDDDEGDIHQPTVVQLTPEMLSLEHLSLSFADELPERAPIRGPVLSSMVYSLLLAFVPKLAALRHVHLTTYDWGSVFIFMTRLSAGFHEKVGHKVCEGRHLESWTFTETGTFDSPHDRPFDPAVITALQTVWPTLHARGILRLRKSPKVSYMERLRVECEETTRALSEGL